MTYYDAERHSGGVENEILKNAQNETDLAILGIENMSTLVRQDFLGVIKGSLATLADTMFYYTKEEEEIIGTVVESLAEATPRLAVYPGLVYEDAEQIGQQRTPTGEIEFSYAIVLDTPWGLNDDPMDYERGLGDKIVLDGTEFKISVGRVVVSSDGSQYRYEKAKVGAECFYTVADSAGNEIIHPNPESLFPSFTNEQQAELEAMSLKTTEAFIRAYGRQMDVLWDKTTGTWWDIKSPGTRDMWREVENRFNPLADTE